MYLENNAVAIVQMHKYGYILILDHTEGTIG